MNFNNANALMDNLQEMHVDSKAMQDGHNEASTYAYWVVTQVLCQ